MSIGRLIYGDKKGRRAHTTVNAGDRDNPIITRKKWRWKKWKVSYIWYPINPGTNVQTVSHSRVPIYVSPPQTQVKLALRHSFDKSTQELVWSNRRNWWYFLSYLNILMVKVNIHAQSARNKKAARARCRPQMGPTVLVACVRYISHLILYVKNDDIHLEIRSQNPEWYLRFYSSTSHRGGYRKQVRGLLNQIW